MTPQLILLTLSLIAYAPASALDPAQYIGMMDPPIPAGCKQFAGGLVVEHGMRVVAFKQINCESATLFLLQEQISQRAAITWRVLDALTIPHPQDGLSILSVEDGCEYTGDSAWVIAVGHWVPETYGGHASKIERGWIVPNDPNVKQFKPVPASTLKCAYSEDRD